MSILRQLSTLHGQCVLISGAGSGIGKAIALELARHGAHIAVNDLSSPSTAPGLLSSAETTAQEVRQHGVRAIVVEGDISDRAVVEAIVERTVVELGALDAVISCAYSSVRAPILELKPGDVQRTLDVTLMGAFHLCQVGAKHMASIPPVGNTRSKRQRHAHRNVIVVSSVMAKYPFVYPESVAYNMAKAALDNMVRSMASELAQYGVRCNAVHPGWIDTPGERKYTPDVEIQAKARKLPFGLGVASDIAEGVAYLLTAPYVTGTTLTIDGGFGVAQRIPGIHQPMVPCNVALRAKL